MNATPMSAFRRPSAWDVVYSINMGLACLIAYAITTSLLISATARDDDLLGGMWAAVATILIAVGTLVMMLLDRREDIITTAIPTIVIIVVAILSPAHAWAQPLFRLFDTVVGIGVAIACKWVASAAFVRLRRENSEAAARVD